MDYDFNKIRDTKAGYGKSQGGDHPGLQNRISRGPMRTPEIFEYFENHQQSLMVGALPPGSRRARAGDSYFSGLRRATCSLFAKTTFRPGQTAPKKNQGIKPSLRQASFNFGSLQRLQIGHKRQSEFPPPYQTTQQELSSQPRGNSEL